MTIKIKKWRYICQYIKNSIYMKGQFNYTVYFKEPGKPGIRTIEVMAKNKEESKDKARKYEGSEIEILSTSRISKRGRRYTDFNFNNLYSEIFPLIKI